MKQTDTHTTKSNHLENVFKLRKEPIEKFTISIELKYLQNENNGCEKVSCVLHIVL
jgi:hypothetical protein